MPLSVAELQPMLHDLFTDTADALAREAGFCQRARKLTGSAFAQTLVFALLENPNATLEDYADFADEALELTVSSQAFDRRFNPEAAVFLRDLFLDALNRSFNSLRPTLLPLLRRFNGVFLRDATLVGLPACLASLFPGRGGRHMPHGQAAAVKLVFEAEVTTGELTEVSVLAGLDNERIAEVADKPLPAGSLLLEDLGFFSGERLQAYQDQGVYFLSRVPAWTVFFDEKGERLDLVKELRHFGGHCLERRVRMLGAWQLEVRLLAVRVPEEEARQRRERVIREAKERGRPVSQKKLDLCEWNILVTNAPAELISRWEAHPLRRLRWQIELVFKVLKSEGKMDETRSEDASRVLCELYAKLLGAVVQQWVLLAAGYVMLRHSARRAWRRLQRRAQRLLRALRSVRALRRALNRLALVLERHCRIERRKRTPSMLDILVAMDPWYEETLACEETKAAA